MQRASRPRAVVAVVPRSAGPLDVPSRETRRSSETKEYYCPGHVPRADPRVVPTVSGLRGVDRASVLVGSYEVYRCSARAARAEFLDKARERMWARRPVVSEHSPRFDTARRGAPKAHDRAGLAREGRRRITRRLHLFVSSHRPLIRVRIRRDDGGRRRHASGARPERLRPVDVVDETRRGPVIRSARGIEDDGAKGTSTRFFERVASFSPSSSSIQTVNVCDRSRVGRARGRHRRARSLTCSLGFGGEASRAPGSSPRRRAAWNVPADGVQPGRTISGSFLRGDTWLVREQRTRAGRSTSVGQQRTVPSSCTIIAFPRYGIKSEGLRASSYYSNNTRHITNESSTSRNVFEKRAPSPAVRRGERQRFVRVPSVPSVWLRHLLSIRAARVLAAATATSASPERISNSRSRRSSTVACAPTRGAASSSASASADVHSRSSSPSGGVSVAVAFEGLLLSDGRHGGLSCARPGLCGILAVVAELFVKLRRLLEVSEQCDAVVRVGFREEPKTQKCLSHRSPYDTSTSSPSATSRFARTTKSPPPPPSSHSRSQCTATRPRDCRD